MSAIFTDLNEATHTLAHAVEPSAVPVFGRVQVVGLGYGSEPVAVNGAQSRVSSSTPPAQIGPSSLGLAMTEAGWAGWSCWSM